MMPNPIRRDTIRTIRRRISIDTSVVSDLCSHSSEANNLIVVNTDSCQSSALESAKTIRIVAKANLNGEMSYLYLNSNDDTIMVDYSESEINDSSEPMIDYTYASDTIKPSDYQFGNMSYYSLTMPPKREYSKSETSNETIAEGVHFVLLIGISISYIYRCFTTESWHKLGRELKSAWA